MERPWLVSSCSVSGQTLHSGAVAAFVSNVSGLQPHASRQQGKLRHRFDHMTVVKRKTALSTCAHNKWPQNITCLRLYRPALRSCSPRKCKSNVAIF